MSQKVFEEACALGDTKTVLEHLKAGDIDPSFNHNFAFRQAAKRGKAEVVRILLTDPRVDPSALANDALLLAVWHNRIDVVRALLMDSRVDPSVDDNLPILSAARDGLAEILSDLLGHHRVFAHDAVVLANEGPARVLAAHIRWGIHAYPALYAKCHPNLVAEYERVRGQCRAVTWVMRELRWEGVAQCVVERLQGFLLY